METITYATVINANRPGLWQCHERYADKQVTPKPRHCSHGEMPYEKINSFFQTTQTITIWYPRFACGAPILSRRFLRCVVSLTIRIQIGRPENERADISQVPYENQIAKQLRGNSRIISSLILSWLHKLYALQRVLHYRVNIYANERRVWHRLAVTMFLGFHIAESGVPTLLREHLSLSLVSWSSAVRMLN